MSGLAPDLPQPHSRKARRALTANLALLALADRLREHWYLTARRHGLSDGQVKVLLNLGTQEQITMRALAERISYDASNLTSLVDRLQRDGLVERRPDTSDRRVTRLQLTVQGRHRRDAFWTEVNGHGPLDALSAAQIAALQDVLSSALDEQDRPAQALPTARV